MCKKPSLSPIEQSRAIAMVESGYTQDQASKALGVHPKVIQREVKRWKEENSGAIVVEDQDYLAAKTADIVEIKKHHSAQCKVVMDKIVNNLSEEKFKSSSLKDSAIAFGIFGEKMALFSGINETVDHRHVLVGKIEVSDNID